MKTASITRRVREGSTIESILLFGIFRSTISYVYYSVVMFESRASYVNLTSTSMSAQIFPTAFLHLSVNWKKKLLLAQFSG